MFPTNNHYVYDHLLVHVGMHATFCTMCLIQTVFETADLSDLADSTQISSSHCF